METKRRDNVMVVDDAPANLKLMEEMLRCEGFIVRSFPRGRLALKAAAEQQPDLILLDINMPEMNGFETCKRLKADHQLASIPVVFLSALNETDDKMRAFQAGGVDYITKPFHFEEVHARVQTHLRLQRSLRMERELLENTLGGAVKIMLDLIHMTSPGLSARSDAICGMVKHMISAMHISDSWEYELAAMLSLIGCIALPPDAFERAYNRHEVSADEADMFRGSCDVGFRLLANIPRLENVGEMIRLQMTSGNQSASTKSAEQGRRMLQIALELDRRTAGGARFEVALSQLKAASNKYPAELLAALENYSPLEKDFEIKFLKVHELKPDMVVESDVFLLDARSLLVPKGTTLNFPHIERLRNFERTRGIRQPIQVRVPCSNGAKWII